MIIIDYLVRFKQLYFDKKCNILLKEHFFNLYIKKI